MGDCVFAVKVDVVYAPALEKDKENDEEKRAAMVHVNVESLNVKQLVAFIYVQSKNTNMYAGARLSNKDLHEYVKLLRIPHFRGLYMRDTLPHRPWINESAVVNLDERHALGMLQKAKQGCRLFDVYNNCFSA